MRLLLQYIDNKKIREVIDFGNLHKVIQETFSLVPFTYFLQKFDRDFDDFVDIEIESESLLTDKDRIKVVPIKQNEAAQQYEDNSFTITTNDEFNSHEIEGVRIDPVENLEVIQSHSKQWPHQIDLPIEKFSRGLIEDLDSEKILSWDKSRELVGHLANYAYDFKPYPNKIERLDICRALVTKYPYLKNNIGVGIGGWELKILNKLKKIRQTDTSLEVKLNRAYAKDVRCKVPKHLNINPKKGELNWSPDHIPGETTETVKLHKNLLKNEANKSEASQDKSKISSLMSLTYSFRREQINNKILIADLKNEYPTFFQMTYQFEEFKRLTAISIKDVFYEEVGNQGPELYQLFKKKKKSLEEIILFNKFVEETMDKEQHQKIELQNMFGFFVIPYLLRDDIQSIFKLVS